MLTVKLDGTEVEVEIEAMARQANGKVVAAGSGLPDQPSPFVVLRYEADGHPDPTFNGHGFVVTKVGECEDDVSALTVQPDGKILVVGTSYQHGTGSEICLLRYLPNGSLDPDFGVDGVVKSRVGSAYDLGHALALQPDGKILVVGESSVPTH